ncbi:hypothetical protein EJ06DRAFT_526896 [Trichodelitschia bisporula]|uniref:BZIP domain-containing protein n=1 Tax=Trichodelitschia bisporula TaxID=703511 RepID=A0A6G1I4V0_9PEZI|nr:hypothetical protein EJ06DRAFT_526896 [Trichodelitschia bisporula]
METQTLDYIFTSNPYSSSPDMYSLPADISPRSDFEFFPSHIYTPPYAPLAPQPDSLPFSFPLQPLTPTASDFGSADEDLSPYGSPITTASVPLVRSVGGVATGHTTSGRRRAQNRAAQRAFRERKEKHARELESQLADLTGKYRSLEASHSELSAAYDKLRRTIEVLAEEEEGEAEVEEEDSEGGRRRKSSNGVETLRKFLRILHGEVKLAQEKIKMEEK